MLRCKEVARICASEEFQAAPLKTRVGVRLHLMMCRHCRRYVRELARIGDAVRSLYGGASEEPDRDEALIRRVLSEESPPGS